VSDDSRRRSGQSSLTNRAPRGWAGTLGDLPGLPLSRQSHLGWQPSRFLAYPAEAERAFALAERLGNFNAAAAELDTTWPSLGKAFTATAWACPPATPRPPGSAAIAAARQRTGQPARPWIRCLWPSTPRPPRRE